MPDNIKATINLNGMSENGLFWCQEMGVARIGGKNILTPNFVARNWIDSGDTGFSGLSTNEKMDCMADYIMSTGSYKNTIVSIYDGTKIYMFHPTSASGHHGLIHTNTDTGSDYPDIIQTNEKHLVYTTSRYINIGYHFIATGASSTSLVVSGATMNATYGIDSDAGTNKIYNLTKKEIYTNTTNNPTDTLGFSAASTTPDVGDEFIVFVDKKYDFGSSYSTAYKRQFVLFGSEYFFLNNSYLASLDSTLATFSSTAKQLPYNTEAQCISVNNSQILVGGSYKNGAGRLMLWDGTDDGWLSILETPAPPSAIVAYQNGWLFFMDGHIYYTDGYQTTLIAMMPDTEIGMMFVRTNFNGMILVDDKLFVSCETDTSGRIREGIYIYDLTNKCWSFTPRTVGTATPTRNTISGCLYSHAYSAVGLEVRAIFSSAYGTVNIIESRENSGGNKQIIVGYLNLPRRIRISKIELNLAKKYNAKNYTYANSDITVSVGDGNTGLFAQATASDSSTGASVYHTTGNSFPAEVGQEFEIVDAQYANAGFRSWIQSIADKGTVNEVWTVSPVLPSAITVSQQNILLFNLKKCGTKTVSDGALLSNLTFTVPNIQTNKLYFEVMIDGTLLDIHGINIY